jgi:hypothetical protein
MTDAGSVPIAGPVFTDWYWEPFFYALLYGPPIAAIAGALYLLGHFTRLRRRRAARAAIALVLAPTLVIGGVAVAATVKHRRTESADARAVTFTVFAAPGFHQTRADVFARAHVTPRYSAELNLRYERGGGEVLVSQVAAVADDDVTPPQCDLHDGTPYVAWDGPCRDARTPQGRLVTLADMSIGVTSLVEVRDGTLIVAGEYGGTEADVLAFADDLRPVAIEDIHWER